MARLSVRWTKVVSAAAAAVLLVAGEVGAQAQATQPAGAAPAMAPAMAPLGQYRLGGYPESYGNNGVFYPGQELRALPVARAQASAAAAQYRVAQSNLTSAVADLQRGFNRSREYNQALADERAAYEALTDARNRALASLQNDVNYQAAVSLRDRVGNQIKYARQQKEVSIETMLALSTLKLSYSATISAMEASAIAADPNVKSAQARLVEAGNRTSALRQQFDDSVHASADVLAARQAVQNSRIAMVATSSLYSEAVHVANVAMTYAYDIYNRPTPYIVGAGYSGYAPPYTSNAIYGGYPIGFPLFAP
jgi:hypothetical protein